MCTVYTTTAIVASEAYLDRHTNFLLYLSTDYWVARVPNATTSRLPILRTAPRCLLILQEYRWVIYIPNLQHVFS